MIELSPEIATIVLLGGLLAAVFTGYPLGVAVGAVALAVGYLMFGGQVFDLLYGRMFSLIRNYYLLAIPLFVFMGVTLETSGIAERMFNALYVWLGGLRGGLAIITVLLGTIVAACVGVVGASITILALVALPAMIKRGYDKTLACGSVCAGATLGQLIPPSVLLVIYGPMASVSVGRLFMGAINPGLILSFLYCVYIAIRCFFNPQMAPVVSVEERAIPLTRKIVMVSTSMIPTTLLVLAVLGSIFFGIAPPTEAAAVGAFAAILLSIAYRRFSWQNLRSTCLRTLYTTSMIYLIGAMSFAYTGVFLSAGCGKVVENIILAMPGGCWGAFVLVMFIVFVLGFFIDVIGIIFIIVPIISPIVIALGFDPVWFGILFNMNLQMAFMTPPFAVTIFYLRGVAPPELGVTMGDIIKGVFPFVGLIMVGIALCAIFPEIVVWLPNMMIK